MALPPSDFASAFRVHVAPRLREKALLNAADLVVGDMTFSEAMADLMSEAYRLGAGYLPGPHREALEDGLAAILLTEASLIEEADTLVASLIRQPLWGIARRDLWRFVHG